MQRYNSECFSPDELFEPEKIKTTVVLVGKHISGMGDVRCVLSYFTLCRPVVRKAA